MKKILLVLTLVAFGASAQASVTTLETTSPLVVDAHCKYKLSDARAGLESYKAVAFRKIDESPDKTKVAGFVLYHNPKNEDPKSVDAITLVVLDLQNKKELTLLVTYRYGNQMVIYEREKKKVLEKQPDGTLQPKERLGFCFNRTESTIKE